MSRPVTLRSRRHLRHGPPDPRPSAGPDPGELAAAVAHLYLEVESGRRPLSQLEPLLAPSLYAQLQRTVRRGPRGSGAVAVQRTSASRAGPRAWDVVVVVRRGARAGSLVLRLERRGDTWRVVELARPEDHGTTYERPALVVRR